MILTRKDLIKQKVVPITSRLEVLDRAVKVDTELEIAWCVPAMRDYPEGHALWKTVTGAKSIYQPLDYETFHAGEAARVQWEKSQELIPVQYNLLTPVAETVVRSVPCECAHCSDKGWDSVGVIDKQGAQIGCVMLVNPARKRCWCHAIFVRDCPEAEIPSLVLSKEDKEYIRQIKDWERQHTPVEFEYDHLRRYVRAPEDTLLEG